MIVADTSGVLTYLDRRQSQYELTKEFVGTIDKPMLMSPIVLAELDYMVAKWVGQHERVPFIREVFEGSYALQQFTESDFKVALDTVEQYADLKVSLADASIVALAFRHKTNKIFTFDQRHFRAIEGPGGKPFKLLPLDA